MPIVTTPAGYLVDPLGNPITSTNSLPVQSTLSALAAMAGVRQAEVMQNQLWWFDDHDILTANATTAWPNESGSSFSGWYVGRKRRVVGVAWSDQSGSFYFQESYANTNDWWANTTTSFTVTGSVSGAGDQSATVATFFEYTTHLPWLRPLYKNGAIAQAHFFFTAYALPI